MVVALALLGTSALAVAGPRPEPHEIGGTKFVLPAGWSFEAPPPGADHVRVTHQDTKRYCIVTLYQPRATGGDLAAEFATEWKSVAGSISTQSPKTTRRTIGKRAVIEASGAYKADEGSALFERVGVLDAGGQITTMVVITANAASQAPCRADSDAILGSVVIAATAPVTTHTPPPATGDTRPGLSGTLKTSVTLADLAGTWSKGAHLTTYTNNGVVTTGSYASMAGMVYTFRANGTYGYHEAGMNGSRRFESTDEGTLALVGDEIHLTSAKGRVQKWQLIAFAIEPDGAANLTTTSAFEARQRLTPEQIAYLCAAKGGVLVCRYGDNWSRAAATK